jgi:chromosome segregation ATPase
MPDVDERLARVEQRLDSLGEHIDGRFAQVDQRFDSLDAEVRGLRILGEQNATDIKRIAEVQAHHGQRLQELVEAVAPLKDLRDFVERVAHDHEHRIAALEAAHRENMPNA